MKTHLLRSYVRVLLRESGASRAAWITPDGRVVPVEAGEQHAHVAAWDGDDNHASWRDAAPYRKIVMDFMGKAGNLNDEDVVEPIKCAAASAAEHVTK